jgi:hypothetical protein
VNWFTVPAVGAEVKDLRGIAGWLGVLEVVYGWISRAGGERYGYLQVNGWWEVR